VALLEEATGEGAARTVLATWEILLKDLMASEHLGRPVTLNSPAAGRVSVLLSMGFIPPPPTTPSERHLELSRHFLQLNEPAAAAVPSLVVVYQVVGAAQMEQALSEGAFPSIAADSDNNANDGQEGDDAAIVLLSAPQGASAAGSAPRRVISAFRQAAAGDAGASSDRAAVFEMASTAASGALAVVAHVFRIASPPEATPEDFAASSHGVPPSAVLVGAAAKDIGEVNWNDDASASISLPLQSLPEAGAQDAVAAVGTLALTFRGMSGALAALGDAGVPSTVSQMPPNLDLAATKGLLADDPLSVPQSEDFLAVPRYNNDYDDSDDGRRGPGLPGSDNYDGQRVKDLEAELLQRKAMTDNLEGEVEVLKAHLQECGREIRDLRRQKREACEETAATKAQQRSKEQQQAMEVQKIFSVLRTDPSELYRLQKDEVVGKLQLLATMQLEATSELAARRAQCDSNDRELAKLRRIHAKYEELSKAHLAQGAVLQRVQSNSRKLDVYKSTIKTQEQVIQKLERLMEAKVRSETRSDEKQERMEDEEATRKAEMLRKSEEVAHDAQEARDRLAKELDMVKVENGKRIQELEEKLLQLARVSGETETALKLKIFEYEIGARLPLGMNTVPAPPQRSTSNSSPPTNASLKIGQAQQPGLFPQIATTQSQEQPPSKSKMAAVSLPVDSEAESRRGTRSSAAD
jgi:hypothetical protein